MKALTDPGSPGYRRLVRASAWYDLIVTAGFMTPWTYLLVHAALSSAGSIVGLGVMPTVEPMQILYANLMGSVVTVWALLRVFRPEPGFGFLDGIARVLFTTWMAYALAHGAPGLLWPFVVVEAAWGLLQLTPWLGTLRGHAGRIGGRRR